ncbi:hypothetical protein BHE74_00051038 [Ensete ventricosum]|nr:hypothetical protein GW17_00048797 [Ensete ventricosum]RWW43310.1 hypothetical protein BHE74_00051038 [Ensete ventricosum]RZS00608.1 hypothetical protein BHM03_00030340 [Ensete ventricosum]
MSLSTKLPLRCFKAKYPELKVDEDPFIELPSDAEVPTPTKVPFDQLPLWLCLLPHKVTRSCRPHFWLLLFVASLRGDFYCYQKSHLN